MRIAYVSLDEVNCHVAGRLAAGRGALLDVLSFRDAPPDGRHGAVLYDLDSLPPRERRQTLAALLGGSPTRPAGVHSYALDDQQVRSLRANGVAVARRLGKSLFAALDRRRARARSRQSVSVS